MNNFDFCVGTHILFGKGQVERLPEILSPFGKKVLLTYGGGSIKRMGLYDRVRELLADFEVWELNGIEPNPRIESVYAGEKLCRDNGIDVILAVGGGSVIDCSKAIAAASCSDEDAWELVKDPDKIEKALPLCTVLTLAATGSEMNTGSVITNLKTKEKLGFLNDAMLPKASILDPTYTLTVPADQTAAGAADILSHIMEVYFSRPYAPIPDGISESLMKVVFRYAPIAVREPDNYEAREQLMWASTLALNGLCSTGKGQAWPCHAIEHELSAWYDITHGTGLAILTPRWMRHVLNEDTVDQFVAYAVNVWGIPADADRFAVANRAIDRTEDFFRSIGIPMTLGELNIDDALFPEMAEHAVRFGGLEWSWVPLDKNAVVEILKQCL